MGFQKKTIRTRLLLLTLVLIIPFIILGFFNLWDFWSTSQNYLNESLEQQAKLASKAFEQHIIAQRQPLIMLSSLMERDEDEFTIQDYLDSAVKTRSEWLDLQILDNQGRQIYKQNVKRSDLKNKEIKEVKEEADRENKFVLETEKPENTGKKTLSMAMPLAKNNTAVAHIDGVSVKTLFETLALPDENLIIVVDKNNRLLYQNKELPEEFSIPENASLIFSKFKEKGSGTINLEEVKETTPRIYGLSTIKMADAVVAVGKPTETLYQPAQRKFLIHAAISLLLTILAIAIAVFITKGITRPMKQLTEVVRRFGKGERSVRTDELPEGTIGELGETFNKMAGEIVEREKELKELDRLKSNFVDSVSHELRTPLTTIKTLTHVLRSEKISNAERREYLGTIAIECNRQIEFIQTLLNLSRIESGAYKINLSPTDVTESIKKCIQTHKRTAKARNLSLGFKMPDKDLPLARTDDEALCLIISSLIENAFKYTPAGGEINISAESRNEKIAIALTDSGTGIAESDIPHIFEKFYRGEPLENSSVENSKNTTKEAFGIGLGLYLVKNLIEELNAEIFVESPVENSDVGTKFTLLLPKA